MMRMKLGNTSRFKTFTSAYSFVFIELMKYMCIYIDTGFPLTLTIKSDQMTREIACECANQKVPLATMKILSKSQIHTAKLVDAKLIAIEKSVSVIIVDFHLYSQKLRARLKIHRVTRKSF